MMDIQIASRQREREFSSRSSERRKWNSSWLILSAEDARLPPAGLGWCFGGRCSSVWGGVSMLAINLVETGFPVRPISVLLVI
jgi:hypothetical protein